MDEVKVIGSEFTGAATNVAFASLEILRFKDMLSWEVWSTNSEAMFPCLRELRIERCPSLIDVSLEALPSLRGLIIHGCYENVLRSLARAASSTTTLVLESILGLTDKVWSCIMKNLGEVEELSISRCHDIRYMWESDAEASKVFMNLKELKVEECGNLVSLGEKEDEDNIRSNLLSSLRMLSIRLCGSMEHLCCPNSIESLVISFCHSVRHVFFPRATTAGGGGQNLKSLAIHGHNIEIIKNTSMPMLQVIDIVGWRNLKSIVKLSNSIHLTSLSIAQCQSMKSFSDLQLSNLTRLRIVDCESIESFPNLQLPKLTHLDIKRCKNIKSFRTLQLPNLISWSIGDCRSLGSYPDFRLSNLTMLKYVCVVNSPMIDASFSRGLWPPRLYSLVMVGELKTPISEWGTQNFPASLVDLRLPGEPRVRNSSQLSHLFPSSLTRLWIEKFDNLESLSMGLEHLMSLQHLIIQSCPKMIHLPEIIVVFPFEFEYI